MAVCTIIQFPKSSIRTVTALPVSPFEWAHLPARMMMGMTALCLLATLPPVFLPYMMGDRQ